MKTIVTVKTILKLTALCLLLLAVPYLWFTACASSGNKKQVTGSSGGMQKVNADVTVFPQSAYNLEITFSRLSSDGVLLLTASYDNSIKLWDVSTGREMRTFLGHNEFVCALAFSNDGIA